MSATLVAGLAGSILVSQGAPETVNVRGTDGFLRPRRVQDILDLLVAGTDAEQLFHGIPGLLPSRRIAGNPTAVDISPSNNTYLGFRPVLLPSGFTDDDIALDGPIQGQFGWNANPFTTTGFTWVDFFANPTPAAIEESTSNPVNPQATGTPVANVIASRVISGIRISTTGGLILLWYNTPRADGNRGARKFWVRFVSTGAPATRFGWAFRNISFTTRRPA